MTKVANTYRAKLSPRSRQRGVIKSGPSSRSRTITVAKVELEPKPQTEIQDKALQAGNPDITGMPPKYAIAIHALLAGKSMTAAAKEAGLNRQYLHTLRKSHHGFQAAYRAEQEYMLEASRAALVTAAHTSIRAMTKMVENPGVPDSVRVRAAEVLMKTTERLGLFNTVPGQTIEHRLETHHNARIQVPEIKQGIVAYRAEAEQAYNTSDRGLELAECQTRYDELETDESELREQFYAHEEAAEASMSEGLRADLEQLCSDIESRLDDIDAESNTLYTRIDELKQLRQAYIEMCCAEFSSTDVHDIPTHDLVETPSLIEHKRVLGYSSPDRGLREPGGR